MRICSFSRPLLGLDIQSSAIHAIQLRKVKASKPSQVKHCYRVEKIASAGLPAGVFVDGIIKQPERFHTILSELVQENGLTGMRAAIGLPVNRVRMQQCQVPAGMPDPLIQMEINTSVKRDFPGMEEVLAVDFTVSPSPAQHADVFFVAAKRDYVLHMVNNIQAAQLVIKIVDIDICGIMRALRSAAFVAMPELNLVNDVMAFLCIYQHASILIIADKEKILLHQQWDKLDSTSHQLQIKNRLPHVCEMLTNMQVNKLLIYDDYHFIEDLIRDMHAEQGTQEWMVQTVDPLLGLTCHGSLQEKFTAEDFSGFLLACGLAMREVPVW